MAVSLGVETSSLTIGLGLLTIGIIQVYSTTPRSAHTEDLGGALYCCTNASTRSYLLQTVYWVYPGIQYFLGQSFYQYDPTRCDFDRIV